MTDVFTLDILKEFKCIGSECPRTCCSCEGGWVIKIEPDLQKKWAAVENEEQRNYLAQGNSLSEDGKYNHLKFENESCVFLSEQNLCSVQQNIGYSYLPKICQEFPRIEFESPQRKYKTATFSCPEITRIFFSDNNTSSSYSVKKSTRTSKQNFSGSKQYYSILLLLDKLLNEILAHHEYPRGVRLFYISFVFSEAIKRLSTGSLTINHLDETRKNLPVNLKEISRAVANKQLFPDAITAGSYWKAVYELYESKKPYPKFHEGEEGLLTRTIKQTDSDFEQIYDVITKYANNSLEAMKVEYNDLLDKYLGVYFSSNRFPLFFNQEGLVLMLVHCMVSLSVIQLILWMHINSGHQLTQQFIEDTIVEVHKRHIHSNSVVDQLKQDGHMRQIDKYCACFLDMF